MISKRSIVADRIEDSLARMGMTAADLSREAGVDESTISNILNGIRKNPRSDTVHKIAKALGTTTDYLYGHTDDWEPSDAPPLPEYARDVMDAMRGLDRARNYELLLIARSFAEHSADLRSASRQETIDAILDFSSEFLGEAEAELILDIATKFASQRGRVPPSNGAE
jgi:transcriptional regulator with XRE-family HTH domain